MVDDFFFAFSRDHNLAVLEHGHAISKVLRIVGVDCQCVIFLQIQRLVAYIDVLYAVFAVYRHKLAVAVDVDAGRNGGVDLVCNARRRNPAAAFFRIQVRAHLQHVQNYLTRYFHNCYSGVPRINRDQLHERDISCRDVGPDAAAVQDTDVCVEMVFVYVCQEVAQVGLGVADDPLVRLGRIIDYQVIVGASDFYKQVGILSLRGLYLLVQFLECFGIFLFVGQFVHQAAVDGHGAVFCYRQLQNADVFQLGSCGCKQNVLAVLVGDHFARNDTVRMSVQESTDAGGVRRYCQG